VATLYGSIEMSASSQIIEKLARSGKGTGFREYAIMALRNSWTRIGKENAYYFSDFIPVRLVTIIENSFKESIKRLIDEDDNCKLNALTYVSKIPSKYIADILFHVDQDSFTTGDIVNYTLSCSNIEDIISAMQSIYGSTFKSDLSQSRERWIEDNGAYKDAFIKDIDSTFSTIQRVFEVRHILVHEMPLEKTYQVEELDGFFEHSIAFVSAMSWLVTFKINGIVPRTQMMMNKVSAERAQETLKELAETYGEPAVIPELLKGYDQHTVWNWFAHLAADARSGLSKGRSYSGSIAPTLYAGALARLNEWRLKDLKTYPDRFQLEKDSDDG
jgi:hypothetical protein